MDNTLPHYTREKLLGEGGMGKVYLAKDNQLQRHVAIKELTYQTKNEKVNFALKEARLLARVNHKNIIQIYNIHHENNSISLIMEYFNSKTLTQFQNENYTTLIQKIALLCQLSAGLAEAHKNGVIHCDLKPSNILVNDQGVLKVTDFGIACLAADTVSKDSAQSDEHLDTERNSSQGEFGCLHYMSPEQIKKQPLDYRSDIFSLGIIAYQLIVGSHPFGSGSASKVAENICKKTPEHASNLMIDAPKVLTDLLMAMLVKSADKRTLTAAEIEHRLKHIQQALQQAQTDTEQTLPISNGETVHVELTQTYDAVKTPSNQRAKYLLSFGLLCLLVFTAVWFTQQQAVEKKQIVVLRPTITDSSLMAPMQQSLVMSAVEDALRQTVINTKSMYLVSQREVNSIIKAYPNDLKKLKQAVGATELISSELACDNSRCKVHFSRLVANPNNDDGLIVKSEKSWLAPLERFNDIYSISQTQFAALYPERSEVNQAGLLQKNITEQDYRNYIELYNLIKLGGNYNAQSLDKLDALLKSSPHLYAAYGLYRDAALDLYLDSQNEHYFTRLDVLLKNSPPEYRFSYYEAIDRFWLYSEMGKVKLAQKQISEAKHKGADYLTILELEAFMAFNSGKYKAAVNLYSNIFKLRNSVAVLNNVAFSNWRLGDLNAAEDILNKILNITPNNYRALRLQANIWLLQGRLEKAINAYDSIIKIDSTSTDLTNLGLAYALNSQYKESSVYLKLAVNKNPKNTVRLLNLADIELILGNTKRAKVIYQKVIDTSVKNNKYRYWLDLSQAYLHLNKYMLAVDALNKAKDIAPDNGEVAYTAALVYSVLGENISAMFEVEKALSNKVGAVWFNLPWFDKLCSKLKFQQLMNQYDNSVRCSPLY